MLKKIRQKATTKHLIEHQGADDQVNKGRRWPHLGLWQHPDFLRLWGAETVSLWGTQVTLLALPTAAILALHAGSMEVGLLLALQQLSFLFVGPFAGVMADRLSRRHIMVVADLGRMLILGSIPLAFALGHLTMAHLLLVTAVVGILTVFFDVSYQSYLLTLVSRTNLVEGNAKLALGDASARIGGPALAGILIQVVGAATAITADALSYLASALSLISIKKQEPRSALPAENGTKGVFLEAREGLEVVFCNPILRFIAIVNTLQNLGISIAEAVVLIFAYRRLLLSPGVVGIAMAIGSIGFVLGALLASSTARKLGIGPTLAIFGFIGGFSYLLIPLGVFGTPALFIVLWRLLYGLQLPIYDINQISLRQAVTPDRLQGRMNATMRTASFGALGVGALVGGFLGNQLGLVLTILLGGIIYCMGSLLMLSRSMITLRDLPDPVTA